MAGRLSEHFSVLLVEAGGEPPSIVSVPAFDDYVALSPDINYFYKSIPQQFAGNRIMDHSMGKMLGGTGSHNSMVHNRGNPRDFDNWAEIVNDVSWKYDNLLTYFKKFENYMGIWPVNGQHGRNGPIQIETNKLPIDNLWREAGRQLGYRYADPNGPQTPGFSEIDVMRQGGRRVSRYTAYVRPFLTRDTLDVVRYGDVQEILISNGRANGVQYLRHGRQVKVYASKQVIICAGALGTPLLLFKSGIGPSRRLRQAGISPLLDLPAVGKYLQDHAGVKTFPTLINPSVISVLANNLTVVEFEKFLNHDETSILSYISRGPEARFVSTVAQENDGHDWPDIRIYGTYCVIGNTTSNAPNQVCFDVVAGRLEFNEELTGSIALNTSAYLGGERDPVKLAIIDDKFLKDSHVKRILRDGLNLLSKTTRTKAFVRNGAQETMDLNFGGLHLINSDNYWNCLIYNLANTHHHTVGTCRMGLSGDWKNSVVDSNLRVHGISNLRIVDASVMPRITNSNTSSPVIAIAEKSVDNILHQFKRR